MPNHDPIAETVELMLKAIKLESMTVEDANHMLRVYGVVIETSIEKGELKYKWGVRQEGMVTEKNTLRPSIKESSESNHLPLPRNGKG